MNHGHGPALPTARHVERCGRYGPSSPRVSRMSRWDCQRTDLSIKGSEKQTVHIVEEGGAGLRNGLLDG